VGATQCIGATAYEIIVRRSRLDDRSPSRFGVRAALHSIAPLFDKASAGGKSELHRAARRITPGQGNLTDQWHRKYTARLRAFGATARQARGIAGLLRRSPEDGGE